MARHRCDSSVCCRRLSRRAAGIAQWLERRTHYRQVSGSSPGRSGGRIFFPKDIFLCCLVSVSVCLLSETEQAGIGDSSVVRAPDSLSTGFGFESRQERRENILPQGHLFCAVLFLYPSVCCRRLNRRGSGIAQWLERRTHYRQVSGSSPGRSGGGIFFPKDIFLCCLVSVSVCLLSETEQAGIGDSSVIRAPDSLSTGLGFESRQERRENILPQGHLFCAVLFLYPSVCCRRLSRRAAGIAQWLERRTHYRQVSGSSPSRSGGRIFFPRVNFLCCVLFRYRFHPRVIRVASRTERSLKSLSTSLSVNAVMNE